MSDIRLNLEDLTNDMVEFLGRSDRVGKWLEECEADKGRGHCLSSYVAWRALSLVFRETRV